MIEIGIRNGSGGKFQTGKDCSDALQIGNGTNVVSVNVVSELADGVVKLVGNGVERLAEAAGTDDEGKPRPAVLKDFYETGIVNESVVFISNDGEIRFTVRNFFSV